MATQAQIAANRRNSQKSTGPRSEAGKANSRANAVRSGLYAESLVIPGEDPAAFNALIAEYQAEFHPVTAAERDLVDMLVRNQWLIRRVTCIETDLWDRMLTDCGHALRSPQPSGPPSMAFAFRHLDTELSRVQARLNALERNYHRALNQLRALQAERRSEEPAAAEQATERATEAIETATGSPEIGFVPSTGPQADSPRPFPAPTPMCEPEFRSNPPILDRHWGHDTMAQA